MLDRVIDIQNRLNQIAGNVGFKKPLARLGQLTTLEDTGSHFEIYVIGEFGRGKSSLINAILNKPILPTNTYPTENHIWVLGTTSKTQIRLKRSNRPVESNLYEESQLATVIRNINEANLEEVLITSPRFTLPEKTYLIEIPGLGDINPQHSILLEQFIVRASAVVFVLEAKGTLSQTEAQLLSALGSMGIPLFVYLSTHEITDPGNFHVQEKVDEIVQTTRPTVPLFFSESPAPSFGVFGINDIVEQLREAEYSKGTVLPRLLQEVESFHTSLSTYLSGQLSMLGNSGPTEKSFDPNTRKGELLLRMVEDQCRDIQTTFREHTEALTYMLRKQYTGGSQDGSISTYLPRQLKIGLDDVRVRIETLSETIAKEIEYTGPAEIEEYSSFESLVRRAETLQPGPPTDYRPIFYVGLFLASLIAFFGVFVLTIPLLFTPLNHLPVLCSSLSSLIVFGIIIAWFRSLTPPSSENDLSRLLAEANQTVESYTLDLQERLADQVRLAYGRKISPKQPLSEKNNSNRLSDALSALEKISREIDDLKRST